MENSLENTDQEAVANRDLVLPYFAPYFAYVGIASIPSDWLPVEWNYLARIVVVPLLLIWAWNWYVPLTGPRNRWGSALTGIGAGLFGTVLWVILLLPFVDPYGGDPWSYFGFGLRLLSASLIVPVFEEIVMRGYIFRVALQWDQARRRWKENALDIALEKSEIGKVKSGAWSVWAVIISTVAFTLGHHAVEWPAAIVYGVLMSWLWIARKDLLSCIVAHGTTNLSLAIYVYSTGKWGLW